MYAHYNSVEFSQVQDCLGLSVLVLLWASSLVHCLPQEWLGLAHVCLLFVALSLFFSLPCFLTLNLVHLDLLLVAALLLEFAAQSSIGINKDISQHPEELSLIRSYIFVFCSCLTVIIKSYCLFLILNLFPTVLVALGVFSLFFFPFSFRKF